MSDETHLYVKLLPGYLPAVLGGPAVSGMVAGRARLRF